MDDYDRSHRDLLDPWDSDPLAPARGVLVALPLGAAVWGMLFFIGWLLAGMRWP